MSMKTYEPHKSSIGGMDANVMALLTYIVGAVLSFIPYIQYVAWLFPLIIFYMEKDSELVKFHAIQSFMLYLISAILTVIINIIAAIAVASVYANPVAYTYGALGGLFVASLIIGLIGLVFLIFSIIAMIKAYKYEEYSIPFFGGLSQKFAAMLNKNKQ